MSCVVGRPLRRPSVLTPAPALRSQAPQLLGRISLAERELEGDLAALGMSAEPQAAPAAGAGEADRNLSGAR